MTIFNNNQSHILLSKDPTFYTCTKFVDIEYYFVCERIKNSMIKLIFCKTYDIIAKFLTKGLTYKKHYKFMRMMEIIKLN